MIISSFWDLTDPDRLQEIVALDTNIQLISKLDSRSIQNILYQYRFIVQNHANHLSCIVSRLPSGNLKTLLEEIYQEEIGNGDFRQSHFYLWNSFLKSLGYVNFSVPILPKLKYNLSQYDKAIQNNSINYAIGLGGMGTECICQVYLTELNRQLKLNPNIKIIENKIDWEFMDLHTGTVDIYHRIQIRKAVEELIIEQGTNSIKQLSEGYKFAIDFWGQLFSILSQDLFCQIS